MSKHVAQERYLNMLQTALGPDVMGFLDDDEVIEIMLNPDGKLLVERLHQGKSYSGFDIPVERSENIIKLVASFKNKVADSESPSVSSNIPLGGARFQGWLPPVVERPSFAIRKRAKHIFTLDDYVKDTSITKKAATQLKKAVLDRQNIVIVGGTGSGKTTFANALLHELTNTEDRILVLEDLPELQLKADDVVFMNTTPTVSMRDLVRGSLRMRPDRIVIGEVRDGAALEMLKAWNTGHPGGVCTIHANSVESTPYRLEDLIQEVVVAVPRNLILQAVDLIVFIERDNNGKRVIKQLMKLEDFNSQSNTYTFSELS